MYDVCACVCLCVSVCVCVCVCVQGAAEYAYGYVVAADKLYKRAQESVPASVQPTLAKVEEKFSSLAVPIVNRAEDAAAKGLFYVDDKVRERMRGREATHD